MKYTVTIGDRSVEVEVVGERVLLGGQEIEARLARMPRTPIRHLVLDGRARTFAMLRADAGWDVQLAGETWRVGVVDERTRQLQELTGQHAKRHGGGTVRAPMPGLVLRVEVEVGQRVETGTGLVVLEAMKMENEIRAAGGGMVKAVHVGPGQAVDKGAPLVDVADEA